MPAVMNGLSRVTPLDEHAHWNDFLSELKQQQEVSANTDVDLYCDGGTRHSAHLGLLCRVSPWINSLVHTSAGGDGECWQECGLRRGTTMTAGEDFAITLAGIDEEGITIFLNLLYTGRAKLSNREDRVKLDSVLRALRIGGVMTHALTLEHETNPEVPLIHLEAFRKGKKKKKKESEADGMSKKCPKCNKFYNVVNGWYKRHRLSKCPLDEGETLEECEIKEEEKDGTSNDFDEIVNGFAGSGDASSANVASSSSSSFKGECPTCKKYFTFQGGWLTRHMQCCHLSAKKQQEGKLENEEEEELGRKKQCKKCHQLISVDGGAFLKHHKSCKTLDEADDDRSSSTVAPPKKTCPKCGDEFNVNGGWFFKHLKVCQTTVVKLSDKQCPKCKRYITQTSGWYKRHVKQCGGAPGSQKPDPANANACKFCGKQYDAYHVWHFLQHEEKCGQENNEGPPLQIHEQPKSGPSHCMFPTTAGNESAISNSRNDDENYLKKQCKNCHKFITVIGMGYLKHRESCSATADRSNSSVQSRSAGDNWCSVCKTGGFKTVAKLKMHLINHFRREIRRDFLLDPEGRIITDCPIGDCSYTSQKSEHLLVHVGLRHNKLREYMKQEDEHQMEEEPSGCKRKVETDNADSAKRARFSPTSDASSEEKEVFVCQKCRNAFPTHLALTSHMTTVNCKWSTESLSDLSANDDESCDSTIVLAETEEELINEAIPKEEEEVKEEGDDMENDNSTMTLEEEENDCREEDIPSVAVKGEKDQKPLMVDCNQRVPIIMLNSSVLLGDGEDIAENVISADSH